MGLLGLMLLGGRTLHAAEPEILQAALQRTPDDALRGHRAHLLVRELALRAQPLRARRGVLVRAGEAGVLLEVRGAVPAPPAEGLAAGGVQVGEQGLARLLAGGVGVGHRGSGERRRQR